MTGRKGYVDNRSPHSREAVHAHLHPHSRIERVTSEQTKTFDLSASFKAYDVRGIVGESITAEIVEAVGAAFIDVLGLEGETVLVGGDMRPSSPEFSQAFAKGAATRGANVSFGDFGLKATERGRLTARQIEAARRAISRHIKRGGRIFIRIFPDKPISQKPAEVRMGNGKGNPEYYVAEIQPGKVLYEIVGVPEELAREAFKLAAAKLPLRTTFVSRQIGA